MGLNARFSKRRINGLEHVKSAGVVITEIQVSATAGCRFTHFKVVHVL